MDYKSEQLDQLFTALAKAQGEYPAIGYNRDNPFYKSRYADLDTMIRTIRPVLAKHGLSFVQCELQSEVGPVFLHSILGHSSGQWIESKKRIDPPSDTKRSGDQAYGASLSYMRRYSAMSLLGITTSNDPLDDDGNDVRETYKPYVAPKEETISKEQVEQLDFELRDYPQIGELILSAYKIEHFRDLPRSKFYSILKQIQANKAAISK